MKRLVRLAPISLVSFALAWSLPCVAQESTGAADVADRPLIVGIKQAPPFAMKTDGMWTGISVEVWEAVANELGRPYTLREVSLEEMLNGLADGSLDVGVGALTVTAEREGRVDFSHPFYTTGLGIAVQRQAGIWSAVRRLFSKEFATVVGALALLLLSVGFAMWLFERRENGEQFGAGRGKGVGAGFWWAAVTMTTVGYGDKVPITPGGRVVGLIWMFASIIVISVFTAGIATALTVNSLGSLGGSDDLPKVRVTSVAGTTSADFLRSRGIGFTPVDDVAAALDALAAGSTDAVVYDEPILRWLVRSPERSELRVLRETLERQDYGFGLPENSPLRERVNRTVLELITGREWNRTLTRYLGSE